MAPRKTDTGTPEQGAEVAPEPQPESEAEVLAKVVRMQDDMITKLTARLDELEAKVSTDGSVEPEPEPGPAPLPEGAKRYYHDKSEAILIKRPGRRILTDRGEFVYQEAIQAEFHNNMYQTSDPEIIAWLDSHEEMGSSLAEMPTDMQIASRVQVTQGVKSAGPQQPRQPLAAPMN